ncbi:MAG: hypothetical protein EOP83_28785 [Verrucomicrobiaceae bacterium]|nr:MAG: hypothetical protein EOP83_28785 [Verrucomicrobiaceae bacterium]
MPFPLAVYLLSFAVGLVAQLVQVVVLLASKVRIEEFRLFYGQALATYDLGRTQLHLGWIPLGCTTKYDIHQMASLPTIARVGLLLPPPVVMLGICLLLLGPEKGLHHLLTGFRQMVEGVYSPQAVGYVLIGKLHELYRQSPAEMVGVICAKWVAWSLLPIGNIGVAVLHQIFSPAVRPREGVERLASMAAMAGFLVSLIWMGIFLVYAVMHWS